MDLQQVAYHLYVRSLWSYATQLVPPGVPCQQGAVRLHRGGCRTQQATPHDPQPA